MTTEQEPDLMPQWAFREPAAVSLSDGLMGELLRNGSLVKEFVMPGKVFRVITKVCFDQNAWLFRCAVTADETELREAPWMLIFRDLTHEVAGQEINQNLRSELAHLALEAHLEMCNRLSRQLEEHGGLLGSVKKSNKFYSMIGAGALIVAFIGVGLHLWLAKQENQGNTSPGTPVESQEIASEEPGDESAHADVRQDETAVAPPVNIEAPTKRKPASSVEETTPSRPMTPPPPATPPPPLPPPPPPSPPVKVDEPLAEPPTPVIEEKNETAVGSTKEHPFSDVLPRAHVIVQLERGGQVYQDEEIIFSSVPSSYLRMTCLTTARPDVDIVKNIAFTLKRPMWLIVAHDQRVRKRPQWLDVFFKTGDQIRAYDRVTGDEIVYVLYRQRFSAGSVVLGVNAEPTKLMEQLHKAIGKKVVMYLVCFDEAAD